jgi:ATP-dependent Clp protease ATP-binding subunit ClpC
VHGLSYANPKKTPRAKAALRGARAESIQLRHYYVGTEHLLLGLFKDGDAIAAIALARLGVTYEAIKARVGEVLG